MASIITITYFSGLLAWNSAAADALDPEVAQDPFLYELVEALAAYQIDVSTNLNSRTVAGQKIRRPRLGRFPDLPTASLPSSSEIENWETEYLELEIGGIAILDNESSPRSVATSDFMADWLAAADAQRLFVSFYQADRAAAEKINEVASAYGATTRYFFGGEQPATVGSLYATAAQRLAIDSRSARRYRTEVTELDFLGEKVRRNSNSLFRENEGPGERGLARREPAVFLKETLGDAFTESTIREIIVPGGVALGETARLDLDVVSMAYADAALQLVDRDGNRWQLPRLDARSVKALFDFVARSESIQSDAIVDIDAGGRVSISSALRDTDVGYEIMYADTQPFNYVSNLRVTKSVVIDIDIQWRQVEGSDELGFETVYEVRFLSADNMRLAQTRVALEYEYESATHTASYEDAWGRDIARLDDNMDYAGLGNSMVEVARYAGWIGLFRRLHEAEVSFLQGRYEFMKIDKRGRNTPARY